MDTLFFPHSPIVAGKESETEEKSKGNRGGGEGMKNQTLIPVAVLQQPMHI